MDLRSGKVEGWGGGDGEYTIIKAFANLVIFPAITGNITFYMSEIFACLNPLL